MIQFINDKLMSLINCMKYLEKSSHQDFRFSPPRIQNTDTDEGGLSPIKFEAAGQEEFNIEGVAVELVYETPSMDNLSPEAFAQLEKYNQINNFRVVKSLKVSSEDKSIVLNIIDLVPVGTQVLVNTGIHGKTRLNNYNSKRNTITINKDLKTAEFLVTILHEVGHARIHQNGEGGLTREQLDEASFYRQFLNNGPEEIPRAVLETILKDERFAWEFAIKSLQPFLNSDEGSSFSETAVDHYASEWLSTYFRKIPEDTRAEIAQLTLDAKTPHEW